MDNFIFIIIKGVIRKNKRNGGTVETSYNPDSVEEAYMMDCLNLEVDYYE